MTLSREGYIKRLALAEYREQKRGGTGKRAAKMKEGDVIEQVFVANTHGKVLCFSNLGRVYSLDVYLIPEGARASKGKAIVKKTPLTEFEQVKRAGKAAISLDEGDSLIGVAITDGKHDVMLFSDAGKAVRFDEACVRSLGRTARGMGGMRLEGEDRVIALLVAEDDTQMVLTACENGYGKCTPISEYTRHARNTKGMIAIATTERNGRVIGAVLVHENDSVMFLSESGNIVRSPVSDVRVTGRAAQGVTLMDVRGDDRLIHIVRVAEDDLDNEGEGGEGDGEAGAAQTGAEDQETAENETAAPDTPSDTTDNN